MHTHFMHISGVAACSTKSFSLQFAFYVGLLLSKQFSGMHVVETRSSVHSILWPSDQIAQHIYCLSFIGYSQYNGQRWVAIKPYT